MTNVRIGFILTALAATLVVSAAGATAGEGARFTLAPVVGRTLFDREYKTASGAGLADGYYFGGRAAARLLSPVWLEFAGGVTEAKSHETTDLTWSHLSANLLFMSPEPHAINPFVSVGLGASQYSPRISTDRRDLDLEAAGGLVVRLTDAIGVRLEARNFLLVPREHYSKAHLDNVVLAAGLSFGFGGKPADADGDGVADRKDRCPNTPAGCQVDENGCSIDSDKDGVCDGVDRCPGTPAGAKVDASGCPTDADGDGVYDGIDRCPDTPKGCTVDAGGCPSDADGDGVCDGVDQCPNTAAGCTVDARGCPIDSDGDGVCDGVDKCPNTAAGAKVDPTGCPVVVSEVQQRETELLDTGLIRLHDIHFETAKANILPESYPRLDVVGEVLSKWPQLKIEIGGHCDSRGSDAYNMALSHRRANSVRAYLLAHFTHLEATQIVTHGYGESQPLEPNTSQENMAKNRRVEFKVLNREVLRQIKR